MCFGVIQIFRIQLHVTRPLSNLLMFICVIITLKTTLILIILTVPPLLRPPPVSLSGPCSARVVSLGSPGQTNGKVIV